MTVSLDPLPRWLASAFGLVLLLVAFTVHAGDAAHPLGGSAPEGERSVQERPSVPDTATGPVPGALSDPPGVLERITAWMLQTQRQLHRDLTQGLHALRDAPTAQTAGALILISLLYGVFHAAGPGHGKAVISAYLLTQPQNLKRGILLSTVSALAQGVTAIVLVAVLIGVLGWLARDTLGQVRTLEIASFALVAMLGIWLMLRALRHAWRLHKAHAQARTEVHHDHNHEHSSHLHTHDAHCGCGTPHHVDPNHSGTWWGTVAAVGIRPCSGAVLIMAVSAALGLAWAGVLAVLAMSLGTAATVSALATLAVSARDWTRRWLGPTRVGRLTYVGPAFGLAGGGVIALIGISLVIGAVAYRPAAHPLGL